MLFRSRTERVDIGRGNVAARCAERAAAVGDLGGNPFDVCARVGRTGRTGRAARASASEKLTTPVQRRSSASSTRRDTSSP